MTRPVHTSQRPPPPDQPPRRGLREDGGSSKSAGSRRAESSGSPAIRGPCWTVDLRAITPPLAPIPPAGAVSSVVDPHHPVKQSPYPVSSLFQESHAHAAGIAAPGQTESAWRTRATSFCHRQSNNHLTRANADERITWRPGIGVQIAQGLSRPTHLVYDPPLNLHLHHAPYGPPCHPHATCWNAGHTQVSNHPPTSSPTRESPARPGHHRPGHARPPPPQTGHTHAPAATDRAHTRPGRHRTGTQSPGHRGPGTHHPPGLATAGQAHQPLTRPPQAGRTPPPGLATAGQARQPLTQPPQAWHAPATVCHRRTHRAARPVATATRKRTARRTHPNAP